MNKKFLLHQPLQKSEEILQKSNIEDTIEIEKPSEQFWGFFKSKLEQKDNLNKAFDTLGEDILIKAIGKTGLTAKKVDIKMKDGSTHKAIRWVKAGEDSSPDISKTYKWHSEAGKGLEGSTPEEQIHHVVNHPDMPAEHKVSHLIQHGIYDKDKLETLTGAGKQRVSDSLYYAGIKNKEFKEEHKNLDAEDNGLNLPSSTKTTPVPLDLAISTAKEVLSNKDFDKFKLEKKRELAAKFGINTTDRWDAYNFKIKEVLMIGYPKSLIAYGSGGVGKAQPLYSKVLTPTGFTTMGELREGSIVLCPDNTESKILKIFPQGKRPVYELTFSNNQKCRSDINHLWKVKKQDEDWDLLTLEQILEYGIKDLNGNYIFRVPFLEVLETFQINTLFITDINYIEEGETQCILIDHIEHLYITDNYIVTHNTYDLMQNLEELKLRAYDDDPELGGMESDEYDYIKVSGSVSKTGLWRIFCENKNKILIFDDADTFWGDPEMENILKAALDTTGDGKISYANGDKVKDSNGDPCPRSVKFTGRAIFISNLTAKDLPQPLIDSRCSSIDLTMSMDETLDKLDMIKYKIKIKDGEGNEIDVSKEDRDNGMEFMKDMKEYMGVGSVNGRILGQLMGISAALHRMKIYTPDAFYKQSLIALRLV